MVLIAKIRFNAEIDVKYHQLGRFQSQLTKIQISTRLREIIIEVLHRRGHKISKWAFLKICWNPQCYLYLVPARLSRIIASFYRSPIANLYKYMIYTVYNIPYKIYDMISKIPYQGIYLI